MHSRNPNAVPPARHDSVQVAALAAAISVVSFRNFYIQGAILLYGDAVAHIHIARRVFDSLTPGPLQLGTVWLPLPHILMIPFLVSDWMWRTGIGGSIVSMIAYVVGTVGVFQLVRERTSTGTAWLAAGIYALNPNLIYLQSTAMTEPLYLALFVWVIVFLDEAVQTADPDRVSHRARCVERAAMLLAAAMLTRYDGWWLAGCLLTIASAMVIVALLGRRSTAREFFSAVPHRQMHIALRNAVLLLAAIPALWLAFNHREYGNALEFATGPYSARAIEQQTALSWRHPGNHDLRVAALYFLKSAKLNLGDGHWEWPLLATAALGVAISFFNPRRFSVWWLLWLPLPFYALSIAYGGVPLFLPVWWPFSYYNVRYGLELLPAVAVFSALASSAAQRVIPRSWRIALGVAAVALFAGSYISVWRSTPICIREAVAGSRTRIAFERALAESLRDLPKSARLLMYTGWHPGALQMAGIPGGRVVDESDHPQWEEALQDPASQVDYVVATDGDPVARSLAHKQGLVPVAIVQSSGQPRTTIYKSTRAVRP